MVTNITNRFVMILCALVLYVFPIVLLTLHSKVYASGISAASSCNPMAQETCGLPFPSDLFRNLSGTYNYNDVILDNRTTGRVRAVLPARLQFPNRFTPEEIINRSTGFSPLGPILFELNDWPLAEIPTNGEGYLHVYNLTTRERVPMVVSLSKAAKAEKNPLREGRPVIVGWPRNRFQFGERYIAVLLKDALNEPFVSQNVELFVPSEGVNDALNRAAGWILNGAYRPLLAKLEAFGFDHSNILSFTWFTVKSEEEVTEPLRTMINTAISYPGYITNLEKGEPLGDEDKGLLTAKGTISMVNFRDPDGGIYPPYDPVSDLSRRRVEFILSLPKVDGNESIPVTVFGHGLGNTKEFTRSGYIMGDRLGMATIAIDHPNHGSRATDTENFGEPLLASAITSPLTIMHLLGMFIQGTIDQNVVIHASKRLLPNAINDWQHPDGLDLPSIDGSQVMYEGLSLGAMLGMAIGATAPDLEGAYLVNGSGSLLQVFSESTFWPLTSNVIPANMNGAESAFVIAMMQHYLDIADGHNFAHYYREPPIDIEEKPLAIHYSLGDGSVPNTASIAGSEIADLPLLKEVIEPEPNLTAGDEGLDNFDNGFGVVQSGYGYVLADRTLESIDALNSDSANVLPGLPDLSNLGGVNLETMGLSDLLPSQLEDLIGDGSFDNLSAVVDQVYDGDLADFMTHFNRNNEAALHRSIEWRCEQFLLSSERCHQAKESASEDAASVANGDIDFDSDSGTPMDQVADAVERGVSGVSVTDNSGGSLDAWFLFVMFGVFPYMRIALSKRESRV